MREIVESPLPCSEELERIERDAHVYMVENKVRISLPSIYANNYSSRI